MLKKIKSVLLSTYEDSEKKWMFISWYDDKKTLKVSQWVVETTKPIAELCDILYEWYIAPVQKEIRYVAIDVVSELIQLNDPSMVADYPPKEFGYFIIDQDDDTSWVLLPNTKWVADVKQVIYDMKQKYWIHWAIDIFVFRTESFVIAK